MRHRPDGSVWVRTFPLTLLHDHTLPTHTHEWDQLTYATAGVLRVSTADASWVVPPHRAVWVPAGVAHAEQMFAPVSVRTLYLAPRHRRALPRECGTLNVSSLLRELILHVSRLGALDRRTPSQARMIGVLLDQLTEVSEVPLQLPLPRDARALRFASLLQAEPAARATVAVAGAAGRRQPADDRAVVRAGDAHDGGGMAAAAAAAARRAAAGRGEPVTTVALEIGYSSVSAFIAVFKRAFGATPKPFQVSRFLTSDFALLTSRRG